MSTVTYKPLSNDDEWHDFSPPFIEETDYHVTPIRRTASGAIVGGIAYTTTRRRPVPTPDETRHALDGWRTLLADPEVAALLRRTP